MDPIFAINSSGKLAVRCIYNTTEYSSSAVMGARYQDEMCLGQFMFYSDNGEVWLPHCFGVGSSDKLNEQLPEPVITIDTIPSRALPIELPEEQKVINKVSVKRNSESFNQVELKVFVFIFSCPILIFLFKFLRRKYILFVCIYCH